MAGTLLIDSSDQPSTLLQLDGQPVWPVRSVEARRLLEEVAALFAADLAEVSATPEASSPEGSEVVVALGDEAEHAGRLYAHLTRRTFRMAGSLGELRDAAPLAVVVTTPPWLRSDLMDMLYDDSFGPAAPGLLCGRPDDLSLQVLIRSAAACLDGPVRVRRVDLYPALEMGELSLERNEHLLLGNRNPASIRRALEAGAGVLSVLTHSDGFDAMLAPDLTLCPMDAMQLDAPRDRTARCVETGYCHRHSMPVSEFLGSDLFVSPSSMRARVLVWDVCFGIMFDDNLVDPRWSLGSRLLAQASFGSVITTWGIVFSKRRSLDMLAGLIARGMPVGEAVYAFNASPEVAGSGQRMCLLGDPRVRLPAGSRPADLPARTSHPGHLEFIKLLLAVAGSRPRDREDPQTQAIAFAAQAVADYQATAADSRSRSEVERRLRETVLDLVCLRGPLILHDWFRFAQTRPLTIDPSVPCPSCRRPHAILSSLLGQFEAPWIPDRRISCCPYCGVVEDVPAGVDFTMTIEDGVVRLGGDLPAEAWSGRLLIRPQVRTELVSWAWPARADGRPVETVALPADLPQGILHVAAVLMHQEGIMIRARFHRVAR